VLRYGIAALILRGPSILNAKTVDEVSLVFEKEPFLVAHDEDEKLSRAGKQ
jgi:hypothetical protein